MKTDTKKLNRLSADMVVLEGLLNRGLIVDALKILAQSKKLLPEAVPEDVQVSWLSIAE